MQDLLRGEWKYSGMIVSDYYGVDQLFNKHFVSADAVDAAATAFALIPSRRLTFSYGSPE